MKIEEFRCVKYGKWYRFERRYLPKILRCINKQCKGDLEWKYLGKEITESLQGRG